MFLSTAAEAARSSQSSVHHMSTGLRVRLWLTIGPQTDCARAGNAGAGTYRLVGNVPQRDDTAKRYGLMGHLFNRFVPCEQETAEGPKLLSRCRGCLQLSAVASKQSGARRLLLDLVT